MIEFDEICIINEIKSFGRMYGNFFFFFFFLYSSKILHLHPTILSNYYTNYTNTTGTGPQGAKDNDYPVAINIKTRK